MEFAPFIRKLEQLYPLSDPEKAALTGAFVKAVSYPGGADIARQGDSPTSCNLLLQGMVYRYVMLPDGKRQILCFHTPGDIFDAHSFMIEKMDHSVAALGDCRVAGLPHETMKRITEEYPRIARAVWKDTLADAAVFREWIVNVGRRSAYQRVAHLICELYTRYDLIGMIDDRAMMWPLTQNDIADATSLSAVHVNRTLQTLRKEKLLELHRGRLQVLDWPGLKQAGDFDANYLRVPQHRAQSAWA